jgi:CMP-N,N'-diacetyllegionaminic acid synthase
VNGTTATLVALIPARSGSKRVPDKNIRRLGGHPLLAYTITAALQSGVCDAVVVSTDSERYAETARYYGAEVPFLRSPDLARDLSPDIEWVEDTLTRLQEQGRRYDCFSILRPTSPFRQAHTIRRAWREFLAEEGVDSLRAVERCRQHPGKMWVVREKRMFPLLPFGPDEQPWHSTPYQALPLVYVQNASLEIAWSRVVFEQRTISGRVMMPFLTRDHEGFDVNEPWDWRLAEDLLTEGSACLPIPQQAPYPTGDIPR